MSAELKRLAEEEEISSVQPGKMVEFVTPLGKIQVIGTEDGFAVRRVGSGINDMRYKEGETFTLNFKGDVKTVVKAVKPENWQAHSVLDSQH